MTRHLLVSFGDRNIIVFPPFLIIIFTLMIARKLLDNTQCDKNTSTQRVVNPVIRSLVTIFISQFLSYIYFFLELDLPIILTGIHIFSFITVGSKQILKIIVQHFQNLVSYLFFPQQFISIISNILKILNKKDTTY